MTASIVGWAHTPFGKFDTETVESLVVKVANEALADAGIGQRIGRDADDEAFHRLCVELAKRRVRPSDDAGCHGCSP